jgi:hypothetical protein
MKEFVGPDLDTEIAYAVGIHPLYLHLERIKGGQWSAILYDYLNLETWVEHGENPLIAALCAVEKAYNYSPQTTQEKSE